jgi:deaminated glutathione amidase
VLCSARALESTAYLVAAAQPGPRYCGSTRILDPYGAVLAQALDTGEQLVVAELSGAVLAEARHVLPVLRARRLGIEAP